jgi:hypothetical protein
VPAGASGASTYSVCVSTQAPAQKRARHAQEADERDDRDEQADDAADQRALVAMEKRLDLRDPLRVRVDERELAPGQRGLARRAGRVEAVLREALLAEVGARDAVPALCARAVERGALQALAEVPVGLVRVGREAAEHVRVHAVEERPRLDVRVHEVERARAGFLSALVARMHDRAHALGRRVRAGERRRVREVDEERVRAPVLRVAAEERRAHVHARVEEVLGRARDWRERLVARREELRDPVLREEDGRPVRPVHAAEVRAAVDGDDDVERARAHELRAERHVLAVRRAVDELEPARARVLERISLEVIERLSMLVRHGGGATREGTYARPVRDVVCARAHLAQLSREHVEQRAALFVTESRKGVRPEVYNLLRGGQSRERIYRQEGLTLKRLALVPITKPASSNPVTQAVELSG